MTRATRWIGIVLSALALAALLGAAGIYLASERILGRRYDLPQVALIVPTDAESIAEGRRIATVHGCYTGCHGRDASGSVLFDQPMIGRIVAPDLTAAVRRYSDTELALIVRHGLRPDGRSVMVMPSESYAAMTDEDLGRIVAFLRSLPAGQGPAPSVSFGPLGRLGLVTGEFQTAAQLLRQGKSPPPAHDDATRIGRYLAQTTCAECHGLELHGHSNPEFTSADLRVVATYTPEAFAALLRTGKALGGRELGMMSRVARSNLSHLTDAEIAALYAYLSSLAGHQQ